MKRIEMIKDKDIFKKVITTGKFYKNNIYILYMLKRNDDLLKFGIAISNKIGKANIRNKLKRQTRVIIDNNKNLFKNGYNYIIMIRKGCLEEKFINKMNAMTELLEKVK